MVCFSTWTVLHGGGLRLISELHDVKDFIIVVLKTLLAVSVTDTACINNFRNVKNIFTYHTLHCFISDVRFLDTFNRILKAQYRCM